MEPTLGIAIWGAFTGTLSLALNWWIWRSPGSRIHVSCTPGMEAVPLPGEHRSKDRFIMIKAYNRGKAKTTVTTLGFSLFNNKWAKWRGKPTKSWIVPNPLWCKIPSPLAVGDTWTAFVTQKDDFTKGRTEGLLYVQVYHSLSDRPSSRKVILR